MLSLALLSLRVVLTEQLVVARKYAPGTIPAWARRRSARGRVDDDHIREDAC